MAEATALWELLRQTADPSVADAMKSAVETGSDGIVTRRWACGLTRGRITERMKKIRGYRFPPEMAMTTAAVKTAFAAR